MRRTKCANYCEFAFFRLHRTYAKRNLRVKKTNDVTSLIKKSHKVAFAFFVLVLLYLAAKTFEAHHLTATSPRQNTKTNFSSFPMADFLNDPYTDDLDVDGFTPRFIFFNFSTSQSVSTTYALALILAIAFAIGSVCALAAFGLSTGSQGASSSSYGYHNRRKDDEEENNFDLAASVLDAIGVKSEDKDEDGKEEIRRLERCLLRVAKLRTKSQQAKQRMLKKCYN